MERNYTQPQVLRETQGGAGIKISKTRLGLKDIPPDKVLFVPRSSWPGSFVVPEQLKIIDFIVSGLEMFL